MSRRRILLAVTGLSPQVVTETVYAMAAGGEGAPDEIHLITTAEGKQRAELALLSEDPGWFHRLCKDLNLPEIVFDADNIYCVADENEAPLNDIRTPADNERLADLITDKVRTLTVDPHSILHASIAGGRKTMGFYLGYALSLYGRPQDKLSHVLVSEPYESTWDFFYPTPYSRIIETRDGALADTKNAEVLLADMPFVSLRDGLPTRLIDGKSCFTETVEAARKALEPPRLSIDMVGRKLWAADEIVNMTPADLAFYAMLARRRKAGQPFLNHRAEELPKQYLTEYGLLVGEHSGDYERTEKALADDDLKAWFEQRKSKTNKALERVLGQRLAKPYRITASGSRPHTRFGLDLPAEAIEFALEKPAMEQGGAT